MQGTKEISKRKISMKKYALVGSGIKTISHLTYESQVMIKDADKVYYMVNEPIMKEWIQENAKKSYSLDEIYFATEKRATNYRNIEKFIIDEMQKHEFIAFVCYGHPTVFAESGLNIAKHFDTNKELNVKTVILPGVSALDCLFADMKIDPGGVGMTTYEVNDMLVYNKAIEPASHTVLWQVGMIGNLNTPKYGADKAKLEYLKQHLLKYYDEEQDVYIYEAALYAAMPPIIKRFELQDLTEQAFTPISTVYIPPALKREKNMEAIEVLGFLQELTS